MGKSFKYTHKTNDVLRMNRRIESSTDSDKHFNVDIEKKIINLDCPSELNYDNPPLVIKK